MKLERFWTKGRMLQFDRLTIGREKSPRWRYYTLDLGLPFGAIPKENTSAFEYLGLYYKEEFNDVMSKRQVLRFTAEDSWH